MITIFLSIVYLAQILPSVKHETYILPEGYIGPVVVIFDEPQAQEVIRTDDNTFVYRIPPSGVLRVKGVSPGGGLFEKRYYYEAADGTRSEIPSHVESKEEHQIFGAEVGFAGGRRPDEPGKRWTSFIVGIPTARPDWWKLRRKAIEDAVISKFESG